MVLEFNNPGRLICLWIKKSKKPQKKTLRNNNFKKEIWKDNECNSYNPWQFEMLLKLINQLTSISENIHQLNCILKKKNLEIH